MNGAYPDDVEHEELLEFIYSIPVGVVRFRADGTVDMINPTSVNLLMTFFGGGDLANIYDTFIGLSPNLADEVAAFSGASGLVIDRRQFDSPISHRPLTLSISIFLIRQDRYMAVLMDATQHAAMTRQLRDAMQTLEESNRLLLRAEALAHIGHWRITIDTMKVYWSAEIFQICDYPTGPALSLETMLEIFHPDERVAIESRLWQVIESGEKIFFDARIIRPDGTIRFVRGQGDAEYDGSGRMAAVVGTMQDVTENTEVENQLRHRQKIEAIGQLASGVAHDFNNLLSIIILSLDIAETLIADQEEARALVNDAISAAESGAQLTSSLLAFGRSETQPSSLIDLNDVLKLLHRMFSRLVGDDVQIVLDLQSEVWPIQVDRSQLEACITNFVANARDAMPNGGSLTITTRNRHSDAALAESNPLAGPTDIVMLAVTDTGIGMTPEVKTKMFDPFFTTKSAGKGTGIGLSMVFNFASHFGGHVSADSEPGRGTTMRLFLPRAATKPVVTAGIREARPARLVRGHREIVLVVEDNIALRRIILHQLDELNYRTLEAENAAVALRILETAYVDLVFSDIEMPGGINGIELARQVRLRWPATKVLLTSALSLTAGSLHPLNVPADMPLLRKPYQLLQFADAVQVALSSPLSSH